MSVLEKVSDYQKFSCKTSLELDDCLAFIELILLKDDSISDASRVVITKKVRLIKDILDSRNQI